MKTTKALLVLLSLKLRLYASEGKRENNSVSVLKVQYRHNVTAHILKCDADVYRKRVQGPIWKVQYLHTLHQLETTNL